MAPGQEVNGDDLGVFYDLRYNNGMLSALIRNTSMRRL